jgi:AraC family transcriptional regulator of adaptative response/methylated-DNA-[protein]-cysteine methyltransferase
MHSFESHRHYQIVEKAIQFITKQAAIDALQNTSNLLEASQTLGLSGT